MKNLAPEIYRQRLVIEGTRNTPIMDIDIKKYLSGLSGILDMVTISEPIAHRSEKFGWAGWIHWETSGCHFYAWEQPRILFSADIYTCKKFDVAVAVNFTKTFFSATEIEYKSV